MPIVGLGLFVAGLAASPIVFSDRDQLDAELELRINLNKKYRDENLESYEESPYKDQWKELENGSYKAMVDLLNYVRKGDDLKLKKLLLRTEYFMEVIYHMDGKEFAETDEEIVDANKSIKEYSGKIKKLGLMEK